MGAILNCRDQSASSDPLVPNQPISDSMTLATWRYELDDPTPIGLRVRLCPQSRCVKLDGQSETANGLNNVSATEPMYFIREAPGGGRPIPALRTQSNQVVVNYR